MSIQEKIATDPRYNNVYETIYKHSGSAFVEDGFRELADLLADDSHDAPLWSGIPIPENTAARELTAEAAIIAEYQRRLLYHSCYPEGSTKIYLHANEQELDGRRYALENTAIKISFAGSDMAYICRTEKDNPFAIITIGDNCQSHRKTAFLDCDGLDYEGNETGNPIELDTFCMLSLIGNTKDGEIGIYTAFHKEHNILYTEFVTGSPDLSSACLSPRAKMVGGDADYLIAVELLWGLLNAGKPKTDDDTEFEVLDENESMSNANEIVTSATPTQGTNLQASCEYLDVNSYLENQFDEVRDMLTCAELLEPPPKSSESVSRRSVGYYKWAPRYPYAGQSPVQIQMLDAIKSTRDDIYAIADDLLIRRTLEVRFSDNTIYWKQCGYTSYYLENMIVNAAFLGDSGNHSSYIDKGQLITAIAVFGYGILTNRPQGFLLTKQGDRVVIYELEAFVMMARVDSDPSAYADFDEWKALDEGRIFFTCFNKTRGLIHVSTPKIDGELYDDFDDDDNYCYDDLISAFGENTASDCSGVMNSAQTGDSGTEDTAG